LTTIKKTNGNLGTSREATFNSPGCLEGCEQYGWGLGKLKAGKANRETKRLPHLRAFLKNAGQGGFHAFAMNTNAVERANPSPGWRNFTGPSLFHWAHPDV